jgi:hypothetical protein
LLTNDFPGVLAMAGPDDFDHMARAYIAAHPSRYASVRWFSRHLADFLATTPPYSASPAVAEMARFEWALGEAFDSIDVAPLRAEAVMAVPPEAWETIAFEPIPSLRRLSFAYDVPPSWQRREEVEPGNLEVTKLEAPLRWIVWRPERASNFRSLEPDEAAMLDAMIDGQPFPGTVRGAAAHVRGGPGGRPRRRPVTLVGRGRMIGAFSH